jgi:hypothetical protein
MLRIPHCIGSLHTDGGEVGEVFSLTHRLRSTPQVHFLSVSNTHFCQRLSKPLSLLPLEGLNTLIKLSDVIGLRIRDPPACSTLPQLTYATVKTACSKRSPVTAEPRVLSPPLQRWLETSSCGYQQTFFVVGVSQQCCLPISGPSECSALLYTYRHGTGWNCVCGRPKHMWC